MSLAPTLKQYLEHNHVPYRVLHHVPTRSLEQAADAALVPHQAVARAVLLSDGRMDVLAVMPLSHLLDFTALQALLEGDFRLVPAVTAARLFPDCAAGCIPALGEAYNLQVLMDNSLAVPDRVYFEGGDPGIMIEVAGEDFQMLQRSARSAGFARPPARLHIPEGRDERPSGAGEPAAPALLCAVESFTPATEIKQRLQQLYDLPPMPQMAQRILQLRDKPSASAIDLARIVELDPSLAAQVIRYANSAMFGYRGKVDSIQAAIARVLGFDMVMNMALGLAAGNSFRIPASGPLGLNAFWRHATYSASLVQSLVAQMQSALRPKPGLAYLAGLLHNFGFLLLGHLFQPEFYLLNRMVAANPHVPVTDLENQVLGMGQARDALGLGHAELGAWLMQLWQMPAEIEVALREHHHADYCGEHAVYAQLVLVADCLLKGHGIGDAPCEDIPEQVLEALGLTLEQTQAALDRVIGHRDDLDNMVRLLAA